MPGWLRAARVAAAAAPDDDRPPAAAALDVIVAVVGVKGVAVAAGVAVLLLLAGSAVAVAVAMTAVVGEGPDASLGAIGEIPPVAAEAYMRAAAIGEEALGCGVDPAAVAAVGWKESRHGSGRLDELGAASPPIIGVALDGADGVALIRDTDGGSYDQDDAYDRAVGPMQFIPATWEAWRQDGTGDGIHDPQNIFDASLTAVWYLCGGGPADLGDQAALASALFRYNRSEAYVAGVLAKAQEYTLLRFADIAGAGDLLAHPGFAASPAAAADLRSGLVDGRLVAILYALADRYPIYVSVIKTGHYECVGGGPLAPTGGCSQSHHWHWRAADVDVVDGGAVGASNSAARRLVEAMSLLPIAVGHNLVDDPTRPAQVGSPWAEFDPLDGFFSDSGHDDHLHIAVCGPRMIKGSVVDDC